MPPEVVAEVVLVAGESIQVDALESWSRSVDGPARPVYTARLQQIVLTPDEASANGLAWTCTVTWR